MGQIENDINETSSAIDELPAEQYRQALKDIIKNNLSSSDEDCSIVIDSASKKGDNYIGVLYRACVKPHDREKELNVIVKLPPQNAARREQFFARPCFLRESEFYENVYPMFKSFQTQKGIEVAKDGFYQIPVCYKSMTEDCYEALFLEDLKVTGFEMFDRLKDATSDHVKLVMASLGKLHAISFAIKDQSPELIEPYKGMQEIFFQRDDASKEHIKVWFDMLKKQAATALELIDNDDLKKKAKIVLENDFFELLHCCIDGNAAEPYAVISHGDCWNNNIMYRYENDVPVEIRLLDWQIMRYASPVTDLLYYIFGCTTKSLRDKHYGEFIDVYYTSLSSFMTRLGSNPSKVFPREVLNDHLSRFGKFGLAMAIMVLPIFTSNSEDVPDMDEVAEKFKEMNENGLALDESAIQFTNASTIDVYNDRMCGVFQDMYDLGYI